MTVYSLTKQIVWRRTLQMTGCRERILSPRREKQNHRLPQPQYNCAKYLVVVHSSGNHIKVQLGSVKPSWPASWVMLTVRILPRPHFLFVWYVGIAIYTECKGTIPQNAVSLSLCFVTHWSSPHHHHLHLHLPSSSSYPEKDQVELLLAVTMPVFQLGPLDF